MAESPLGLGIATRRVLADVVTDDLRDAIIAHELEPGWRGHLLLIVDLVLIHGR